MKAFFQFVFAMIISFIPGAIGVMFTPMGASDMWYNALNKSMLTPAGWVFMVAWIILYALLGVALFLIIRNRTRCSKAPAYWLFVIQMVLNALWSYMFFGMHLIGLSFIVLIALLGFSFWMTNTFRPISRAASYLVWPYLAWLIFALYLNGTILVLN